MASDLNVWYEKEFNEFIKSKKSGLVMFGAPWCGACQMITPILQKIAAKFISWQFAKIDVVKNPGLASRMGVMSLPNILIFKKGKIAEQIIGVASQKSIEEKLKVLE